MNNEFTRGEAIQTRKIRRWEHTQDPTWGSTFSV